MLVRREALIGAGGFDVTFPYKIGEMFDLNLRLLSAGRLAIVWTPLLMYRRHSGNTTSNGFEMDFYKLRTFEFVEQYRSHLPPAFLRALSQDLPARRRSLTLRAFESGQFETMHRLMSDTRTQDRKLYFKVMRRVAGLPKPFSSVLSRIGPKIIRRVSRLRRRAERGLKVRQVL